MIKDVPTTQEGGLPEFQVSAWNAIVAPRNLAPHIQAKLNDALVKALDDELRASAGSQIGSVVPAKKDRTPPEALQRFVESEVARWSLVLKAARRPLTEPGS